MFSPFLWLLNIPLVCMCVLVLRCLCLCLFKAFVRLCGQSAGLVSHCRFSPLHVSMGCVRLCVSCALITVDSWQLQTMIKLTAVHMSQFKYCTFPVLALDIWFLWFIAWHAFTTLLNHCVYQSGVGCRIPYRSSHGRTLQSLFCRSCQGTIPSQSY